MKLDIQKFASGVIEFPEAHGNKNWKMLRGKIEWSSVTNANNNTSTVTTKLYAKTGTGGTSGKSWHGTVKVNGNAEHSFTDMNKEDPDGNWSNKEIAGTYVLFKTYTDTVNHNNDGTCSVNIKGSIQGPSGTSLEGVKSSGNKTVYLDTIPRYFYLDVNGMLDDTSVNNISGYGTIDVNINDNRVATGVTDFYNEYLYGSRYNIIPHEEPGHQYIETTSGSLSGTITGTTTVTLKYNTRTYWNNINVLDPNNNENNNIGLFDLYVSGSNRTYTDLGNEPSISEMTQKYGTYFDVYNIRANKPYLEIDRIEGYDSTPSTGKYRKVFNAPDEILKIYTRYKQFTITYNANGGTGPLPSPKTYTYNPNGSVLLSSNILDKEYHRFLGWSTDPNATFAEYQEGDQFPTNIAQDTILYAIFAVNPPYITDFSLISATPFELTLKWDAVGLSPIDAEVSIGSDIKWTGTNKTFTLSNLQPETEYNILLHISNVGGSADETITVSTLTDQAKIYIKKNGEWKQGKVYYKENGQWVKAKKVYIKENGEWKINKNKIN